MPSHRVGTREQWAAAYRQLRIEEKDLTRRNEELARKRQVLPWVPVEQEYRFETKTASRRSLSCSTGVRSYSCAISCTGPRHPRAVPVVRLRPITSSAPFPILRTAT